LRIRVVLINSGGLVGDLISERRAVLLFGERSSPTLILPVSPILISSGSWW
jgi:hypothetical protein